MNEMIRKFREQFYQKLGDVDDVRSLEDLRLDFLSKKGHISTLMKELSKIPNEKKKEYGQSINSFKQELTDKFEERKQELVKLQEKLSEVGFLFWVLKPRCGFSKMITQLEIWGNYPNQCIYILNIKI